MIISYTFDESKIVIAFLLQKFIIVLICKMKHSQETQCRTNWSFSLRKDIIDIFKRNLSQFIFENYPSDLLLWLFYRAIFHKILALLLFIDYLHDAIIFNRIIWIFHGLLRHYYQTFWTLIKIFTQKCFLLQIELPLRCVDDKIKIWIRLKFDLF